MRFPETSIIIYKSTPHQNPEKDLIYTAVESHTVYVIGNYFSLAPHWRPTNDLKIHPLVNWCAKNIKRQLR
jgi:hypothetical protein